MTSQSTSPAMNADLVRVGFGRRHPLDGQRIRLTRRVVWLLVLQATVGVTGFNYCTAEAVRHTGAATVGTVIAAVPVVLAIAGPLAARRGPRGG